MTDFNLTVWKFELSASPDVQRIEMPVGARILDVGEQLGKLCVWALVTPGEPRETRLFRIAGTGHSLAGDVDPGTHYAGRAEFSGGALQVHVFDLGPEVDSDERVEETGADLRARIWGDYQTERERLATDGDDDD